MHNYQNKISAFSLVEMLMALLVASLLLAALAPVMTKKAKENINVHGGVTVNNGNEVHGVQIFEYDSINDSDKEYSKFNFTIPQGVYTLSLILQAGGGGGGGSTSGYTSYNNILQTSDTVSEQTITIEDNLIGIKNVRIDLTGGGGGGGGGMLPVIDCKDPNLHKYINPTQGNGVQQCVNKFNVGDSGGPAVTGDVTRCERGISTDACLACANSANINYGKCYHTGAYKDCSEDIYGGRTGCGRTGVQYYTLQKACATYTGAGVAKGKWRIPSRADITKWNANMLNIKQGANGMQICGYDSNYNDSGAAYCLGNNGGACYGSYHDDCDLDRVWLSDTGSNGTHCAFFHNFYTNCNYDDTYKHNSMSGRCITTDNEAFVYSYKTGGGGGSGVRIYNYTLPEIYNGKKLLEKGNSITITRGNSGSGGSGAGVNGSNGSPSCITVKDAGGVSIFYLCANGGNYGNGATVSSHGAAGGSIATCRIGTSSSNNNTVNCSTIGNGVVVTAKGGNNGVINSSASYNTTVSGGNGGVSTYNTSLAGGEGGSGIATKTTAQGTINGKAPSVSGNNIPYGAGGGGGSSGRGADSSTPIAGNGGSGYMGYAKITYDVERTGGSGGGGGGGSMVAISSLEVKPGEKYEIIAGKGGNGGNVNADGLDGYLSSFKNLSNPVKKAIETNPGKGGKRGDNTNEYGTGGEGGSGGNIISVSSGYGTKTNKGESGLNGYNYDFNPSKNTGVKKSIGGNGGKSGIGTNGGCGGLSYFFEESSYNISDNQNTPVVNNNCKITNINADSAIYLLNTLIMGTDYGKAGSGGGGGGFESFSLYGTGGSGGNGYVFVKW